MARPARYRKPCDDGSGYNVLERGASSTGETMLIHELLGHGTMGSNSPRAFGPSDRHRRVEGQGDACVKLGADRCDKLQARRFVAEVKAANGGDGANVILDMVGGD